MEFPVEVQRIIRAYALPRTLHKFTLNDFYVIVSTSYDNMPRVMDVRKEAWRNWLSLKKLTF